MPREWFKPHLNEPSWRFVFIEPQICGSPCCVLFNMRPLMEGQDTPAVDRCTVLSSHVCYWLKTSLICIISKYIYSNIQYDTKIATNILWYDPKSIFCPSFTNYIHFWNDSWHFLLTVRWTFLEINCRIKLLITAQKITETHELTPFITKLAVTNASRGRSSRSISISFTSAH